MRGDEERNVARVLEARARALAQPPPAPPDDLRELLVSTVGETRVAVPLERIREVLPPGPTACLPGGPHALAGVRVVRSELVVVADPGPVLGIETPRESASCFALVLDDASAPVGLLVDVIDAVVTEEAGARVAGGRAVVDSLTADGVMVLDVDALLADPRLRVERSAVSDEHQPNEGAM